MVTFHAPLALPARIGLAPVARDVLPWVNAGARSFASCCIVAYGSEAGDDPVALFLVGRMEGQILTPETDPPEPIRG